MQRDGCRSFALNESGVLRTVIPQDTGASVDDSVKGSVKEVAYATEQDSWSKSSLTACPVGADMSRMTRTFPCSFIRALSWLTLFFYLWVGLV